MDRQGHSEDPYAMISDTEEQHSQGDLTSLSIIDTEEQIILDSKEEYEENSCLIVLNFKDEALTLPLPPLVLNVSSLKTDMLLSDLDEESALPTPPLGLDDVSTPDLAEYVRMLDMSLSERK